MPNQKRRNIEWIFSGIGVAFPLALFGYLFNALGDKASVSSNVFNTALTLFYYTCLVIPLCWILFLLIKKGIISFVKFKLKEIANYVLGRQKIKSQNQLNSEIRYDCFELYKYHEDTVDILHKFICKNQGELAQFIFNAGEFHKPLKTELQEKDPNLNLLNKIISELPKQLFDLSCSIFEKSDEFITEYFGKRSNIAPRWCVKWYNDGKILDYYRPNAKYSQSAKIGENTGCDEVLENGLFYLCNDIPQGINAEKYYNPRIMEKQVRDILRSKENFENEEEWCNCWVRIEKEVGGKKQIVDPPNDSWSYCQMLCLRDQAAFLISSTPLTNFIPSMICPNFSLN